MGHIFNLSSIIIIVELFKLTQLALEWGEIMRKFRRKNSVFSWLIAIILVTMFFIIGLWIGVNNPAPMASNIIGTNSSISLLGFFIDSHQGILNMAIPVLGLYADGYHASSSINTEDSIVEKLINGIIKIDVNNPKALLDSEIKFISSADLEGKDEIISESPALTEEEIRYFEELERKSKEAQQEHLSEFGDKPLVLIYNTHNSETYKPTDGAENLPGQNAGVEKVAAHLEKKLLEKYGIKSVRSTTVHDYPNWERSYINSEQTVKKLLQENPSIQIVVDIHRDAGLPSKGVITASTGEKMANILIVVGSDRRLSHPHWKQNEQFAKMVGYKMDKLYPGLLKSVRVQSGRYNQHLHQRAILLEMGCTKNSLEEALNSAEAMAHVIYEVLIDLRQENTF